MPGLRAWDTGLGAEGEGFLGFEWKLLGRVFGFGVQDLGV